jgi:hypothetical protein
MYHVRVYEDRAYVCENTASRYGYREWPNGSRTGMWYEKSPLEEFMERKHPGVLRHRWSSYAGTGKNLIGTPRSFGHGAPGGAYWLTKKNVLRKWMDRHTKAETKDLYDTLATGSPSTGRSLCEAIYEEAKGYPD